MQAAAAVSRAAWCPAAGTARRPARRPVALLRAAENDGLSWLDQQEATVQADIVAEQASALAEAADDTLARKVGLHIRGRATFRENNTDESDPARHQYHMQLKQAATNGESSAAERTILDMEAAGLAPGPRAYHAFVFAHVKDSSPSGALAAIRRCWEAGVVPLPETYAAVVAAHLGAHDLDTAEAVLASNRRAGVDCTRSWQLLVAGLFKMGNGSRAMEAYAQGEAEGLLPDAALYQALIQHMCSQGDADGAATMMQQMQERGLALSGRDHLAPIIRAYAAQGQPQEALAFLQQLLVLADKNGTEAQLLCDAVLEAQLEQTSSMAEVLSGVQRMKAIMVVNGLQPGPQAYAAQLRAALRLQELQEALQAFRALRRRASGSPLSMVDDEALTQMLVGASSHDLPAELHELLAAMCEERRDFPPAALQPDADGHTALAAWVKRRLDSALAAGLASQPDMAAAGESEGQPAANSLVIDGVLIDPATNMVVDASGEAMGVTRMGVRELRAELAARRAPVSGNKKELVKRLQKLRAADLARAASMLERPDDIDGATGALVARVRRRAWLNGRLIEDVVTDDLDEEERAALAAADDDGDEGADWDAEALDEDPLSGGTGPLAMNAEEEDESLYDDTLPSMDDLREAAMSRRHMLSASPTYASPQAGPRQAAAILLAAVAEMRVQPSEVDFAATATWASGAGAADAAMLLVAALDQQPQPVEGTAGLRAQMAELYALRAAAEGGDELEVALAELLQPMGDDDGDAAWVAGELAEWTEAFHAGSLAKAQR